VCVCVCVHYYTLTFLCVYEQTYTHSIYQCSKNHTSQFPLSSLCQHTAAPYFGPSLLSNILIIFTCFLDTHVKKIRFDPADGIFNIPFRFCVLLYCLEARTSSENSTGCAGLLCPQNCVFSQLQHEAISLLALLRCR